MPAFPHEDRPKYNSAHRPGYAMLRNGRSRYNSLYRTSHNRTVRIQEKKKYRLPVMKPDSEELPAIVIYKNDMKP